MNTLTGIITALAAVFLLASFVSPVHSDDFSLDNKSGTKVCVGKICDDSNAFYYFECCGTIYDDCCFRLQTWVWIVIVISAVLTLGGAVVGFIKCICCCDR